MSSFKQSSVSPIRNRSLPSFNFLFTQLVCFKPRRQKRFQSHGKDFRPHFRVGISCSTKHCLRCIRNFLRCLLALFSSCASQEEDGRNGSTRLLLLSFVLTSNETFALNRKDEINWKFIRKDFS